MTCKNYGEPDCCQATQEDLCRGALNHYKELSEKAFNWHNQIEQAIKFWYLEKPALERKLAELEPKPKLCCEKFDSCIDDCCVPKLHHLLEQERKVANRYRWLRDGKFWWTFNKYLEDFASPIRSRDEADKLIDKEIENQKNGF